MEEIIEQKYTVTCNREQLSLIAQSLELNTRMRCGQLGRTFMRPIDDMLWKHYNEEDKGVEWSKKEARVKVLFEEIKEIIWPGGNYGIGHDEEADLGYEMYKQILSKLEEEREAKCIKEGKKYDGNVHTGEPLKLTKIPVIKIKNN